MQLPYSDAHLSWPVLELDLRYLELMFADCLNEDEADELEILIAEKEARAVELGL